MEIGSRKNNSRENLFNKEESTTPIPPVYSTEFVRTTWIISNSTPNATIGGYCENNECTKATIASFFIGFPCFAIAFFCIIFCLGFTCGGVVGGSAAASCQSACYGGATTGCFSCFQSAGAGGCMGICCVVSVLSIIGSGFATATWYLCVFTCKKLNE